MVYSMRFVSKRNLYCAVRDVVREEYPVVARRLINQLDLGSDEHHEYEQDLDTRLCNDTIRSPLEPILLFHHLFLFLLDLFSNRLLSMLFLFQMIFDLF